MKNLTRWFSLAVILLFIAHPALSGDTLLINITYKHKLNNEGNTTGYMVVKQQFMSADGVFFREINFDDQSGSVTDYVFRFYRDGQLFTEEFYNGHDSLTYILKHDFDSKGNEVAVTKLLPGKQGFSESEKTVKNYSGKQVVSSMTYYGKNRVSVTKYKYNNSGLPLSEKSTAKPSAKTGYLMLSKVYSYNDQGKTASVAIKEKSKDGKLFNSSEKYEYNEQGLVSSIKHMNESGTLTSEKVYKYLKSGAPSIYEEHDSTGKMTLMMQYEYRKHIMEKGTQVSRYENL